MKNEVAFFKIMIIICNLVLQKIEARMKTKMALKRVFLNTLKCTRMTIILIAFDAKNSVVEKIATS